MKRYLTVVILFCVVGSAAGQTPGVVLRGLMAGTDSLARRMAIEKLYVQTDKQVYYGGDTIWFKGYLCDAGFYGARSELLYIEFSNDKNELIKRLLVPVYGGLAAGQFALPSGLPGGGYVLRAYTNWMRNFGEALVFSRRFFVYDIADRDSTADFSGNKRSIRPRPRSRVRDSALAKRSGRDGREDIDLQFMPEGGDLIAGVPAHIAFKAIGENGRGVSVSGRVFDRAGQRVAAFSPAHAGIGAFDLVPVAGEVYSATIDSPAGLVKSYPLPPVRSAGTTLRIIDPWQSDSLEVDLACRPAGDDTCYLTGEARGKVCYGAWLSFHRGDVKLRVPKNAFPSGIVRFVLSRSDGVPLNERIIFIDHHDNLIIRIEGQKQVYGTRDSVALHISVTDKNGQPVQGHFSLAVTDDGQVATDSMADGSILSRMLLTGDLRGTVEDPGYYFAGAAGETRAADGARTADETRAANRDLLLLAQGWVGYRRDVDAFVYPLEEEFMVRGRVVNAFNRPVAHTDVTLFSRNPTLFLDTVTDMRGVFFFRGLAPMEEMAFFLQARNKKGKSNNVSIEVEEFKPPVFSALPAMMPHDVDTSGLSVIARASRLKREEARITGKDVLQTVVVRARRVVVGSKNRNGPGEADLVIGEKELEQAGRTTLGDLLQKAVPGFRLAISRAGVRYYSIGEQIVHLVIDGLNIELIEPEGIQPADYFRQYLDYYSADDIKGIEVMRSSKYVFNYMSGFLGPMSSPDYHAFIEITTRGGKGPFMSKTAGTFVYRPMGFTLARAFYSPRYTAESKADMTDIRSTIFWAPEIVTDKDGQATVHFYTADDPGSYSLILEGCDLQGALGATRTTLFVRSP